ncbi:hypothetical protein GCM10023185_07290 [Hymenobacter saemangeumensis]|uniref:Omp28-related outer membrane protein n=1 Tax=Hymenobacter saemangeumensis TaxID=1084522 RepID=A0ABP8I323_9BACT
MKHHSALLLPLLLLASSLALLPGCDVVENPIPPTQLVSAGRRDTLQLDSAERARPVPLLTQHVLLEDYTGQFCGNCPAAGTVANALKQQHGERLSVLEAHVTTFFAGPKADPKYQTDFRTPIVSDELDNVFGLSNLGLPKGAVNRAPLPGSADVVLDYANWPAAVTAQLSQTPQQALRLTTLFAPGSRRLRMKINSRYLTAQPGRRFRLGIYITEDSLLGWQKDYTRTPQDIPNFPHRHVLRTALNGTFGTLQATNPTANQEFTSYVTYTLSTAWNARRSSVIVFLADDATRRVVQVAEEHVK